MSENACSKQLMSLRGEIESSAVIDSRGLHLIQQALTEAVSLGTDCEIEQMVRAKNVPAIRQRAMVQFEFDVNGMISAVRVTFERDGEVVRSWLFDNKDEIAESFSNRTYIKKGDLIDIFTTIVTKTQTVKQHLRRSKIIEAQYIVDDLLPKLQEFWLKSHKYDLHQTSLTYR